MWWLITFILLYVGIGCLLAWIFSAAAREKFKLNKEALPFILTWPKLIYLMITK